MGFFFALKQWPKIDKYEQVYQNHEISTKHILYQGP